MVTQYDKHAEGLYFSRPMSMHFIFNLIFSRLSSLTSTLTSLIVPIVLILPMWQQFRAPRGCLGRQNRQNWPIGGFMRGQGSWVPSLSLFRSAESTKTAHWRGNGGAGACVQGQQIGRIDALRTPPKLSCSHQHYQVTGLSFCCCHGTLSRLII